MNEHRETMTNYLKLLISAFTIITCFTTFLLSVISCSSDDESLENQRFDDILILNERNVDYQGDIFLTIVTNDGNSVTSENLTESLDLGVNFTRVKLTSEYVTFHEGFNPVTLSRLDIITKKTEKFNISCGSSSRYRNNNIDYYYMISEEFENDTFSYSIEIYSFNDRDCRSISLGNNLLNFSSFTDENYLYLGFNLESFFENYKILKIDLLSSEIIDQIEFPKSIYATIKDQELLVFNGFMERLEIYDKNTFENIEYRNNIFYLLADENLFTTDFTDNKMLSILLYPQPGPISRGPIIIDLLNADITEDISNNIMFRALNEISETSGEPHYSTGAYAVDLEKEIAVIGFSKNLDNNIKGALAYTDFDGNILKTVELDYVPKYISFK